MGLFAIVALLLKHGAKPNLMALDQRKPHIDYGELPLDVVMNRKHHGKDLSLEGLTFTNKINLKTEQDFGICLSMLLKYGAELDLDP